MLELDSTVWRFHDGTDLSLQTNDLDIWAFSHGQMASVSQKLWAFLADDERERATKYYTVDLQNQYIVRRGMLRTILSYYLNCSASDIIFHYGERGKPAINEDALHFNLSHSRDAVVVAIATEARIGIDVEFTAPIPDMRRVAEHHFSANEQANLFALNQDEQMTAFYRCWTRKEAYIKADGRGLGIALDSFDVTLAPEQAPTLLRVGENDTVASEWTMQSLPLKGNYLGAVLVYGAIHRQRFWHVDFESLEQLS